MLDKGAIISKNEVYRYMLWRVWLPDRARCMFVCLNPSTADAQIDDPTILKCMRLADKFGYGGFYMGNLFAYRSTNPDDLLNVFSPVGKDNDKYLREYKGMVDKVIAGWGNLGWFMDRCYEMSAVFPRMYCLGTNQSGQPKHPLYLNERLVALKEYL